MNSKSLIEKMVGILFLTSTVTYMSGSAIFDPIKGSLNAFSSISSERAQITFAAFLILCAAISNVVIGVLMFSLLRKHNEMIALSYVITRIFDGAGIALISIATLAMLAVGNVSAGSDALTLAPALLRLLASLSKDIFTVTMIGLGIGGIPLCYLLLKHKLIPKAISVLGLVSYIALAGGSIAEYFHLNLNMVHYAPGAVFELVFPLWLIVKGLNTKEI